MKNSSTEWRNVRVGEKLAVGTRVRVPKHGTQASSRIRGRTGEVVSCGGWDHIVYARIDGIGGVHLFNVVELEVHS